MLMNKICFEREEKKLFEPPARNKEELSTLLDRSKVPPQTKSSMIETAGIELRMDEWYEVR